MYPPPIQKLINLFSRFPTVGPRTAARFVFYLLQLPKKELEELLNSISDLRKEIKICLFCFNPFEPSFAKATAGKGELCKICSNPSRDKTLLCIVEKETDLFTLEKTKKYNGLYFILGGTISTFKKEDIKKLKTSELLERVKNPKKFGITDAQFKEIIIAINPTTEGESTALYLKRLLKPLSYGEPPQPIKITRLGQGLPVGAELEYADEETLGSALEGRK